MDVAQLCTSELATNTYLHAQGETLLLRILAEPLDRFRVGVYDTYTTLPPAMRTPAADRPHGRGLGLVAALADAWGTAEGDPMGWYAKGVWFELKTRTGGGR